MNQKAMRNGFSSQFLSLFGSNKLFISSFNKRTENESKKRRKKKKRFFNTFLWEIFEFDFFLRSFIRSAIEIAKGNTLTKYEIMLCIWYEEKKRKQWLRCWWCVSRSEFFYSLECYAISLHQCFHVGCVVVVMVDWNLNLPLPCIGCSKNKIEGMEVPSFRHNKGNAYFVRYS